MAAARLSKVVTSFTKLGGRVVGKTSSMAEASRPSLEHFWSIAKVELAMPAPAEIPAINSALKKALFAPKYDMTIKEVLCNAHVLGELFVIFFFGEVLAKGRLIGYPIPGAYDYIALPRP